MRNSKKLTPHTSGHEIRNNRVEDNQLQETTTSYLKGGSTETWKSLQNMV